MLQLRRNKFGEIEKCMNLGADGYDKRSSQCQPYQTQIKWCSFYCYVLSTKRLRKSKWTDFLRSFKRGIFQKAVGNRKSKPLEGFFVVFEQKCGIHCTSSRKGSLKANILAARISTQFLLHILVFYKMTVNLEGPWKSRVLNLFYIHLLWYN